jgi:Uma2 family endonuclease
MPATELLTSEQFLALPVEYDRSGNRIRDELVAGEVVISPIPFLAHSLVLNDILRALIVYADANQMLGFQPFARLAYVVDDYNTLVPDVSVIKQDRLKPHDDQHPRGAPEIAIEVVSPTDTVVHLKAKVEAYLQNGSKTVWVVYPDSRSVMVYRGDVARELKADQQIEDPLLPGFSTPVSTFFEL